MPLSQPHFRLTAANAQFVTGEGFANGVEELLVDAVDDLEAARQQAPFDSAEDLARRADLDQADMRLLAG